MKLLELNDADGILVRRRGEIYLVTRAELDKHIAVAHANSAEAGTKLAENGKRKSGPSGNRARLTQLLLHTPNSLGATPTKDAVEYREGLVLKAIKACTKAEVESARERIGNMARRYDWNQVKAVVEK